jgi:hypothetical protein
LLYLNVPFLKIKERATLYSDLAFRNEKSGGTGELVEKLRTMTKM